VQGGQAFVALSAGARHTCGLAAGGAAFCWGGNQLGQLGDSTQVSRGAPVAVAGGHAFTSISAGTSHTCALTAAAQAFCWGLGEEGALGIGADTALHTVPQPVAGGIAFASISAGDNTTCGISTAGDTYCWGVQYGTNGPVVLTPTLVAGFAFTAVQAGGDLYCGTTASGDLYCWGLPPLGNGTSTGSAAPILIDLGQGTTGFGVGVDHTCAITQDGRTSCWGHLGRMFLLDVYFLLPAHIIAQG
jgi:alpha-tubulin suppressor-like RCC1 family protein